MLLHNGEFCFVEPARFIEDLKRNLGLADIMEQTGDTDLMDLCLGKSLLLGNDHSDGCNIDTVLEGVFITCLECGDIDRDRVVLVDGREQIGSDRVGCLYHFRRTGIAVYILDSLRDTLTDARG